MNEYDIRRLGLILSIQADIEAMKIKNKEREIAGDAPAYDEMAFRDAAEDLRKYVYAHKEQLCPFCGSEAAIEKEKEELLKEYETFIKANTEPIYLRHHVLEMLGKIIDFITKIADTRSCYPAEFIEWAVINYQYSERKNRWIKRYVSPDRKENQLALEELYKIWRKNI